MTTDGGQVTHLTICADSPNTICYCKYTGKCYDCITPPVHRATPPATWAEIVRLRSIESEPTAQTYQPATTHALGMDIWHHLPEVVLVQCNVHELLDNLTISVKMNVVDDEHKCRTK